MKRLKELRKARGLTQQQMADVLGVDRTTYTKYETGINDPSFDALRSLAIYFDVTTDYLLELSDTPNASTPPAGVHIGGDTPMEDMDAGQRAMLSDFANFLLHKAKQNKEKPE